MDKNPDRSQPLTAPAEFVSYLPDPKKVGLVSFIKDAKGYTEAKKSAGRVPLTQGVGGPQIGWVENIHKDQKGNIVGDMVFTEAQLGGKIMRNMIMLNRSKLGVATVDASPLQILEAADGRNDDSTEN